MSRESRYGKLIRVDRDGESVEVLQRVPLASGVAEGALNEASLQRLLFDHPECLPIETIDAAYGNLVPVCRELSAPPSGSIDALYINALGRLTLCEFKLWRNPQARREVIGQILDYATVLASWGYEDLQRQVSLALGKEGSNVLYELVSQRHPHVVEAEFVDNVTRYLKRGEFLLLIVGDGIQERAEKIVDFVQRHSGLHFNLALVEAALYRDATDRLIVQPRVLARTEIVHRFVVDSGTGGENAVEDSGVPAKPQEVSHWDTETRRFWTAVLQDFAFSDPDAEISGDKFPITVKVQGSGLNGAALRFVGSRSGSTISCYLSARAGWAREERIFDEIVDSLEDLSEEIRPPASQRDDSWEDLKTWQTPRGRPCLGFRRECELSFLAGRDESEEDRRAVGWMRDRLNRLVSVLHPRLRQMLAAD